MDELPHIGRPEFWDHAAGVRSLTQTFDSGEDLFDDAPTDVGNSLVLVVRDDILEIPNGGFRQGDLDRHLGVSESAGVSSPRKD